MKSSGYDAPYYDAAQHVSHSYGHTDALMHYNAMPHPPIVYQQPLLPNGQLVLVGLTAISKAVGAGPGTIKKWIKEENFPVRRCSDGIYRASPDTIKEWFAKPPRGNA